MARPEGFEPSSMVLETTILPLNYGHILVDVTGIEPVTNRL